MRLVIRVKEGRDFYYSYDVGLRRTDNHSSKTIERHGEKQPRYFEDFIERYGKDNIQIISYGKLNNETDYINKLLLD